MHTRHQAPGRERRPASGRWSARRREIDDVTHDLGDLLLPLGRLEGFQSVSFRRRIERPRRRSMTRTGRGRATEQPPHCRPAANAARATRARPRRPGPDERAIDGVLLMSPKTVRVHVTNIGREFGVANGVEAATVAERAGLLDAGPTVAPDHRLPANPARARRDRRHRRRRLLTWAPLPPRTDAGRRFARLAPTPSTGADAR